MNGYIMTNEDVKKPGTYKCLLVTSVEVLERLRTLGYRVIGVIPIGIEITK